MDLEDQVIADSDKIKVTIRTFINQNTEGSGIVFLESPIGYARATIDDLGKQSANFARRLMKGEKVLVVEYEGKVKAIYGPLDPKKLHINR